MVVNTQHTTQYITYDLNIILYSMLHVYLNLKLPCIRHKHKCTSPLEYNLHYSLYTERYTLFTL